MKQVKQIMAATAASTALALLSGVAHADFVGVNGPNGWSRGDTNSGFLEFDDFVGTTGVSFASGSGGGVSGTISQFAPIAPPGGLFGASPDTRVYVHDSAVSWTISTTAASFDVNYLQLQVKEGQGTGLAGLAVFANGEAADVVSVYDDGNSNAITSFRWILDSTITAGTSFDITVSNGPFSFDSYDSFSVDAATVPVPAAAWLFGSALLGLGIARRRG